MNRMVSSAGLRPLGNHARPPISNPGDENTLGVASELGHASEELRGSVRLMLGQTLIVRDRATARRLLEDLPTHARIVTLRGEVFRGDGLILAGKSASTSGSALNRPRQKRELTESLATLGGQIESFNHEVDSLSAQIAEAQRELNQADQAAPRIPGRPGRGAICRDDGPAWNLNRPGVNWNGTKSQQVQLQAR